ncbi:MAG: DUF4339 domain-containing protein [Pedobacter sp.]|nr:DUF4339 domain-containing protein [Chitinophagaceae bacterium]
MSTEKIYLLKENKLIRGPYTYSALKIRGIRKDDKIWYEGLKDWTPVISIEEFKEMVKIKTHSPLMRYNFLSRFFSFLR